MSLCGYIRLGCLTCNIFVENVVFFRNIVQNLLTALVDHKDFPFLVVCSVSCTLCLVSGPTSCPVVSRIVCRSTGRSKRRKTLIRIQPTAALEIDHGCTHLGREAVTQTGKHSLVFPTPMQSRVEILKVKTGLHCHAFIHSTW
jgi:hypothetical protein